MRAKLEKHLLLQDAAIIFISVLVAVILAKTGILKNILTSTKELELLGGFLAGMFFTSIFTTQREYSFLASRVIRYPAR